MSHATPPEYTVGELSAHLKSNIEARFGRVRVRGEVGRVSRPQSGHIYFDLKDENAVLSAVIWRGTVQKLSRALTLDQGLEVVCSGRMSTFAGQSRYQLLVDTLAPTGIGALMAQLEERRRTLEAEGLFAHHRPIPFLPQVVGIITSPSGAVIRDMLHQMKQRPPIHVLVWPTSVQGEQCAQQVVAAIQGFGAFSHTEPLKRPEVLIIARGGGSFEDLWPFNDEAVVRAAAQSAIPVISAIGHESDSCLLDAAADARAPTPTAAAKMISPSRLKLLHKQEDLGVRLQRCAVRTVTTWTGHLQTHTRTLLRWEDALHGAAQRLDLATIRLQTKRLEAYHTALERHHLSLGMLKTLLGRHTERFEHTLAHLHGRLRTTFQHHQHQLTHKSHLLEVLGHKSIVGRGFALVRTASGEIVRRATQTRLGDTLTVTLSEGTLRTQVISRDTPS